MVLMANAPFKCSGPWVVFTAVMENAPLGSRSRNADNTVA